MTKFNASQLRKHGFTHVTEEDFNDDGTKFQIWMHEESGLKVSYARYTFTKEDEKVTEYFISPRESYYEHGLLHSDICNEPEYKNSDKFNGCFEVDVDELVELLVALHEMFLRVKKTVDNEETDMTEVIARAEKEKAELEAIIESVKQNVRWWELKEYDMKFAARDMQGIEREIRELDKVLDGGCDRRKQRELAHRVSEYGYVADRLEEGSEYGYYNTLRKLANK